MAFLMLLRRMGRDDLTAHGFRSTFRDWAAERTNLPAEVAKMALAHAVSDKVRPLIAGAICFKSDANSLQLGRSSAMPRGAPQRLFQSAKPLRTDRRQSGRLASARIATIRVAVVRDPHQATPLTGDPSDLIGGDVEISVTLN
jgi:hypothetical protein